MLVYVLLVVFIIFFALACEKITPTAKGKTIFVIVTFAAIGILIGFHSENVGSDSDNYFKLYREIENLAKNAELELGFVYLVKFLRFFTRNPQALFVFQGLLVAVSYSYFIIKNTETVRQACLAVLTYLAFSLFSFNLSGVRQSIAMCICLFAYEMIKREKAFKFLILILVAYMFHQSAILFIPAYFVGRVKEKTAIIISVVSAIVGFLFIDEITEYIANISERYEKYGVEKTDNGYIFFAIMTLILIFFAMNKARILKSSESLEKFSKINFFCYALWVMRLATRTVERVSFYYLPSTILIVSHSTKAFKRHENNVLYTLILAVLLIALFLYRMRGINYVFC